MINGAFFCDTFHFYEITRDKYHYSDNRAGSPEHYLAYMKHGRCRIVSEQGSIEVGSGDVFYIPKGLPYQSYWYSDTDEGIRFCSYGFQWFPEAQNIQYILQVIPCDDETKQLVQSIPTQEMLTSEALGYLYHALAALLPKMKFDTLNRNEIVLRKAKKYIYDHPSCTVTDVARHCEISDSTVYTIFRNTAEKTPLDIKREILCEKAIFLLSTTNKSVQEISDMLGFSSTSYFRKVLKATNGKTPREIRKQFTTV